MKNQSRSHIKFRHESKHLVFGATSKHQASKKGYTHTRKKPVLARRTVGPTNHQRMIVIRAERLGLSILDYCNKFGANFGKLWSQKSNQDA